MWKSMNTGLVVLVAFAPVAAAQQGGWLIETDSVVSPTNPTTTVEVWAWFDDPVSGRDTFAWGDFDFLAGDGEFSNPQMYLWNVGNLSAGTPDGNVVTGVFVGQLWGFTGITGNPDNPVLVWSADWTATDFTPRTVLLGTRNTTTFNIGINSTHSNMKELELYPEGFFHGTGAISVVPSPATALPIALFGTLALRRRRTS